MQAVKAELDDISFQDDNVDVSIDNLKILTDAVLVEKALAEILEGQDALSIVPAELTLEAWRAQEWTHKSQAMTMRSGSSTSQYYQRLERREGRLLAETGELHS